MAETDKRCIECKKDWTKCGTCPVMMEDIKIPVKDINDTTFLHFALIAERRALECDRSSYIKGYNDAFTASKEVTDLYKLFTGMSETMQEAVRKIMETTQKGDQNENR